MLLPAQALRSLFESHLVKENEQILPQARWGFDGPVSSPGFAYGPSRRIIGFGQGA
jgi:hypothetical protein